MEGIAKVLVAFLFAGIAIALAKGGWTGSGGALDWFKSKFLGLPPGTTAPTASSTGASAPTSATNPTSTVTIPRSSQLPQGTVGVPAGTGTTGFFSNVTGFLK